MGQDVKKLVRVQIDDIELYLSPESAEKIVFLPVEETPPVEPIKAIVMDGGEISREDLEEIFNRR